MFEKLPSKVSVVEVGPRDGLQNEKAQITTFDKLEYIDKLIESGLETIEVTSFVKTKNIPQMHDSDDLYQNLITKYKNQLGKLKFPCFVPNLKGYINAINSKVSDVSLFSATSETFTKRNVNCTIDETFQRISEIIKYDEVEHKVNFKIYISTVFGCPYEGKISVDKVMNVMQRAHDLGIYQFSLGDTIGVGTPKQVYTIIQSIKRYFDLDTISMHFHDTRGLALTNILVSIEEGIKTFDSSSGGLGGCPYAKGATGNVATEDVVYLLNSLNIKHHINLDKLALASRYILDKVGKKTPSKFLEAYFKSQEK